MAHVTDLHGTLNRSDFAYLRSQLSISMSHNDSLQDFIGAHQLLHDQFAEAQQPLSELDKCHHFREAVKTLPHIHQAIESYLVTHPLVEQQLYRDMTTHVLQQAPNFTPTAASMGYAATAILGKASDTMSVTSLLESPAFAALITTAIKHAFPARRPHTAIPKKGSVAKTATDRVYCYHHGYDSHKGTDCRYMVLHEFSPDKRTAATHGSLPGASTNRF